MIRTWRPVQISGITVHTSVTEDETERLQILARNASVLEVGSAFGYSAIALAQTARRVTLIDPFEQYSRGALRENLRRAGTLEKTRIITGTSQNVLPVLHERGERYGLVFIDGDHAADAVAEDLRNGLALLTSGGYLAAHDYDEDTCPGVRVAIDALGERAHMLTGTLWETW